MWIQPTAFVKDGFPLGHDGGVYFISNDDGHDFIWIGVEKSLDFA
jgi:hypothetical protein